MNVNTQRIEISKRQLHDLLEQRIGRKAAKAIAYSKNRVRVIRRLMGTIHSSFGNSRNLKDIRLLALLRIKLSPQQEVILLNNKQRYFLS